MCRRWSDRSLRTGSTRCRPRHFQREQMSIAPCLRAIYVGQCVKSFSACKLACGGDTTCGTSQTARSRSTIRTRSAKIYCQVSTVAAEVKIIGYLHVRREADERQKVQNDHNHEHAKSTERSRTERVLSLLIYTDKKEQRASEHKRRICAQISCVTRAVPLSRTELKIEFARAHVIQSREDP